MNHRPTDDVSPQPSRPRVSCLVVAKRSHHPTSTLNYHILPALKGGRNARDIALLVLATNVIESNLEMNHPLIGHPPPNQNNARTLIGRYMYCHLIKPLRCDRELRIRRKVRLAGVRFFLSKATKYVQSSSLFYPLQEPISMCHQPCWGGKPSSPSIFYESWHRVSFMIF